ncbi:hypothetical protein [Micromonospora robiginosa]|uniref:HK97 gp10 family phage protein n=1 Tax=Micromonospora robiginosa TaxID=2749844 RepID=A0A7L6B7X8_9ACTN|nr:hypothetical protein [Micromonospora ferruginea]QLQ37988.1 hypothetical protein H1D33_03590 [Micromonospora ferruginea]
MEIDTRELRQLEYDFAEVVTAAPQEARKVVQRAVLNIKTDAQRRVGGLRHAPAYPRSISYDTRETPVGPEAEIGPDKGRRQGALGNLIEFGSVNNAPRPHINPAADAELPRFERAMEDLAVRLLGER